METTKREAIKTREMVGYAFGNMAQNIIYLMISVYLLYFYTDVFGITAAAAGTLFLAARMFDGLNDPIMGFIADRTKSKMGRFRPYILFGMIPLAAATVLLFSAPDLSDTGKLFYAYITYFLQGIFFTIVLIPYFAMPAAMTQDSKERSKISVLNILLSTIAAILVSVVVKPIVALFPTEKMGYQMTTIFFMVISIIAFYVCFRSTKERIMPRSNQKNSFRDSYKVILKNAPLLMISISYIFFSIQYTMRMQAVTYYAKYNLGNDALTPIILGVAILFSLTGTALSLPMMNKFGKKATYLIGAGAGAVLNFALYFVPPENFTLLLVLLGLGQMALATPLSATWSMAPDAVDYGEWKMGIRAEGVSFGAFSFVQKLASALAGSLAGVILTVAGYVANAKQTPQALNGILHMLSTIPAVCCAICFVIMLFYQLNTKKMNDIVTALSANPTEA